MFIFAWSHKDLAIKQAMMVGDFAPHSRLNGCENNENDEFSRAKFQKASPSYYRLLQLTETVASCAYKNGKERMDESFPGSLLT